VPAVAEGSHVGPGTVVADVDGATSVVLAGERTALDFLMVLSGIASETARWVAAAGPRLDVLDTRKTVPGIRELSKYAVRVGGGSNHRTGLFDMALVKDNHLARSEGISIAAMRVRARHPGIVLEIEADRVADAVEAVEADADIVLLDNMDDGQLADAVVACRAAAVRRGRAVLLEASGGIRPERLASLSRLGIDRVSSSTLTFARPVDFGLDEA
jgi:nicotinate-nucleotide pyrophosphorylase (carboxylating)